MMSISFNHTKLDQLLEQVRQIERSPFYNSFKECRSGRLAIKLTHLTIGPIYFNKFIWIKYGPVKNYIMKILDWFGSITLKCNKNKKQNKTKQKNQDNWTRDWSAHCNLPLICLWSNAHNHAKKALMQNQNELESSSEICFCFALMFFSTLVS